MNRLLAGIVGALGLGWLLKKRRDAAHHEEVGPPQPAPPEPDPRAEELRARIEEAKSAVDDREEFEAGETPVDEADVAEEPASAEVVGEEVVAEEVVVGEPVADEDDPAARRAAVHEQARARISEMAGARGGVDAADDEAAPDAAGEP